MQWLYPLVYNICCTYISQMYDLFLNISDLLLINFVASKESKTHGIPYAKSINWPRVYCDVDLQNLSNQSTKSNSIQVLLGSPFDVQPEHGHLDPSVTAKQNMSRIRRNCSKLYSSNAFWEVYDTPLHTWT